MKTALQLLRGTAIACLGVAIAAYLVPFLWQHQSSFAAELSFACLLSATYCVVYGVAVFYTAMKSFGK